MSSRKGHFGVSNGGDAGIYAAENVYLRPSCTATTADDTTTFTSSYGLIVSTSSVYSDNAATTLGSSNKKWTTGYITTLESTALNFPSDTTNASTTTRHITFLNGSTALSHIGASGANTSTALLGLYSAYKIVLRPALSGGVKGVEIIDGAMYPSTNAAAANTENAMTLGSSTNQWDTTYARELVVNTHANMSYNSTDETLDFIVT